MNEQKADQLLRAAKRVLDRFESGYHPSEGQLRRLRGAIDACEVLKVCGHNIDEDCNCFDDDGRRL